jgi:hypothetical protein
MGVSSKFNQYFSSREDLYWQVYNHEPLYGEFSVGRFQGTELPASAWSETEIARFFGGDTQEDPEAKTKIGGKVEGSVTLYGLPNCIIGGDFNFYAKAKTRREYEADGETVVTWERTGGLKYTGFSVGVDLANVTDNRQGICFAPPTILVYLRERDNTIEPDME